MMRIQGRKATFATIMLTTGLIATTAANAQQAPLNAPYVTSTGETVPNPGKSQSGGTTSLDRSIQREDNKIDSSICKGC